MRNVRTFINIVLAATLIVACERQNLSTDRLSIPNSNNPPPGSGTGPTPSGGLSPWLVRKSIPGIIGVKGRYQAWAYSIGPKGYVGGGYVTNMYGNTGAAHDQYAYDSLTLTWTQTANSPGTNLAGASSFVIGNNAYVCTGSMTTENWQYNSVSNAWTRKADFPGGRRIFAVGAASGGKGYVGTGSSEPDPEGIQYNDWWQYDATADHWTRKANYQSQGRLGAVSFVAPPAYGGKIYVGTGVYAVNLLATDFRAYDPASDTWSAVPAMPAGTGRDYAVGLSLPQGGVVLAGNGGSPPGLSDNWEFNYATNTWSALPVQGARINACGFTLGNNLYIAGGYSEPNGIRVVRDDMYSLRWPY